MPPITILTTFILEEILDALLTALDWLCQQWILSPSTEELQLISLMSEVAQMETR